MTIYFCLRFKLKSTKKDFLWKTTMVTITSMVAGDNN